MPITKPETSSVWENGSTGLGSVRQITSTTTDATGVNSVAEGTNTLASGNQSHSEGTNTISSNTNTHAEGEATTASGLNSHSQGKNTFALGKQAHAEGTYNIAKGEGSHAAGRGNMAFSGMNRAAGNFSVAGANINYFLLVGGKCYNSATRTMYVRGDMTSKVSNGDTIYWGHSDNQATYISTVSAVPVYVASGANSVATFFTYTGHTEIQISVDPTGGVDDTWAYEWGYLATDYVTNPADFWTYHSCFVDGSSCYAIADNASAFGYYSRATGNNSRAEGVATKASNYGSHSEGMGTISSGEYAHSEGYGTKASRAASHSEGSSTTASAEASHAEGTSTVASGYSSHAGGKNATASRYTEWARSNGARGQYGVMSASAFSYNATPFILYLDESSSKFTIPSNTAYKVKLECVVINYTNGDAIEFEGKGLIKNLTGTTSLVGAFTMTSANGDAGLAGVSITVTADDTNDCLQIECTGIADSLDWFCEISYQAVNRL